MNVVVMSLTRDRAEYSRHCFQTLRENAGINYDHFILDQASDDDTPEVLEQYMRERADESPWMKTDVTLGDENIGVCKGMNYLLDIAGDDYDVYVKFDNDCELTTPDTLKAACELVHENEGWIVSPHIQGLLQPPPVGAVATVSGYRVGLVPIVGGIFQSVPQWVFVEEGYRHNPGNPIYGHDDIDLSAWFRGQGGNLGYLLDFPANHYLTTAGQQADQQPYFARKFREMGLV